MNPMSQLLLASWLTAASIALIIFLIETAVFLLSGRLLKLKSPNLKFGECAWILFVTALVGGIIAGLVSITIGPTINSSENIYILGILTLVVSVIPLGLMFYLIRKRFSATAVQAVVMIIILVATGFGISYVKETLFWNWVELNAKTEDKADETLKKLDSIEDPEKDLKVVFDLPEGWVKGGKYFEGWDIIDGYHIDSDNYGIEVAGYITVGEIENEENLSIKEYFEKTYQNCTENNPVATAANGEDDFYIDPCWMYDKDPGKWDTMILSEFLTYSSQLYGIPESGAQQEDYYVAMNGKFIKITATYLYGANNSKKSEIEEIVKSMIIQ